MAGIFQQGQSNRRSEWAVWLVVVVLGLGYVGLRWIGFEEKIIFGADSAEHMLESYEMWQKRELRLIGPIINSKRYEGRGVFLGPQYYYLLAGLGVMGNWEIEWVTKFLSLVEMMVFLVFSWWILKKYGVIEGITIGLVLVLSPYLIANSRFIWNPHVVVWLGLVLAILLEKRRWFWVGIVWGLAISFHFAALLLVGPIWWLARKEKKKLWLVAAGAVVADLPYLIFELRHNFYNLRTLWLIMSQEKGGGMKEWHYFINPLLGVGLWLTAELVSRIKESRKKVVAGVIIVGIGWWMQRGIEIKEIRGWNYGVKTKVAEMILGDDCPNNFNVASTVDGNTKANDLRYLLTVRGCAPMGEEEYPKMERLFLVAGKDRPAEKENVWEVSVGGKAKLLRKEELGEGIVFYELGF